MAAPEDLRQELRVLTERVAQLEREVATLRQRPGFPRTEESAEPVSFSGAEAAPPGVGFAQAIDAAKPKAPEADKRRSLEARIGSQVLNRVGIFAVLAGAAWFLKLAIDRGWIGPWPRVMIGLLAAVGLSVWGEGFRRGGFAAFGHTLQAIGTGLVYLCLWTAFSVYHLIPAGVAFLLMLGVTAGNSGLAWRQNSVLLAGYALAGGMATPGLLWTGGDHEIVLFLYLLALDGAVIALAVARPWERLVPAAFVGTIVYYSVWWFAQFTTEKGVVTAVFVVVFFVVFAVAGAALGRKSAVGGGWGQMAFSIANGVLTFAALEALLRAVQARHGQPWVALGLAVCFAGLLRVPGARMGEGLWRVHVGLAAGFLALVGPLGFPGLGHGTAVALFWVAEALGLVWAAGLVRRVDQALEPVVRGCALGALVLAAADTALLGWIEPPREPVAVALNAHFGAAVVACAGFAGVAWWMGRRVPGERLLRVTAMLALNVVALAAVSVEIHHYWACGARVGADLCAGASGRTLAQTGAQTGARFTYSVFYMVYGAGLMAAGFWRRSAFLRWQALVLLLFAVGKVFVFDASGLSSGYRVMSFLGLGMLLLGVSFAYQRDWLALKE